MAGTPQLELGMPITAQEFGELKSFIYQELGIHLTEEKKSLLVGRLQGLARAKGVNNFHDYLQCVKSDHTGLEMKVFADRISTHHTFFNREPEHFEFLKTTVLPEIIRNLKAKNQRDIRLWCAAASSGEEPYTLAMVLREALGQEFASWEAGLLATDLSDPVLDKARLGFYPDDQVLSLGKARVDKFFRKVQDGYEVQPFLKKDLTYRRFNLVSPSYPFKKPFDVIFCRNVLIYFDQATKDKVVANLSSFLKPGGYLFVGHSESLGRGQETLRYVRPAVYRKSGAA